tara:strand:- start:450 stop:716 length:267 start_codon:yes stop_codon:yes gene_type:complete
MGNNRFWEIIYDDENHKMEVIGSSTDDTRLTNNVAEMQRIGMKVRCQTGDINIPENAIELSGYEKEKNLYSRLLLEYEAKTNKHLNRW